MAAGNPPSPIIFGSGIGRVLPSGQATAGGTLYTDGTNIQNVGAGTSGQLLQSNGASAPTWVNSTATFSRVSAQYYATVSTTMVANTNPINFDTVIVDNTSAVTTGASWKFTAPSSGDYLVIVNLDTNFAVTAPSFYIYKNGTTAVGYLATPFVTGNLFGGSKIVTLVANDFIQILADAANNTSNSSNTGGPVTSICIQRVS